jgi:hypothetical protein
VEKHRGKSRHKKLGVKNKKTEKQKRKLDNQVEKDKQRFKVKQSCQQVTATCHRNTNMK